ncbi:MAG: methyltransferase domain-containing protein [Parvibaculum sp.]
MQHSFTPAAGAMVYDRHAGGYDRRHKRFLRIAGNATQSAVEGMMSVIVRPGMTLLDAGCGTGRFGCFLRALEPEIDLTLLDASPAMLSRIRDGEARVIKGCLTDLPFLDDAFDAAVATWSLETLAEPACGLGELMRVIKPGGTLCIAICVEPEQRPDPLTMWLMRRVRKKWSGRQQSVGLLRAMIGELGGTGIRVRRDGATAAIFARKTM